MNRHGKADPHQTQSSELSAQLEGFLRADRAISSTGDPGGPLAHIPLFARLDAQEQADLFAMLKREAVPANQTVFWLGDRGDTFYLVDSGQMLVTVPNSKGEHVTIASLGPGGFFGEISLLDGGVRTATVRAGEASELLVLSRKDFHAFLLRHPHAAVDILAVMGQRQRASNEALRQMANPNELFEQSRVTPWQRVSDVIATVAASQWFTIFHLAWFGLWILLNTVGPLLKFHRINPPADAEVPWWIFDPFPFGLLTMVVSLEAIFLSIFVMVSQNRQSEKDRLRTDLDFQVNVKAETEIVGISRRLEQVESMLTEALARREQR